MVSFSSLVSDIASTYGTDTIFILGKGPSATKIPPEVYSGSVVIGINDAERVHPTAVTIFHASWVKDALEEVGSTADLYLTSTDFRPKHGKSLRVPHAALGQDGSDLMMQRLLSGPFVVEDVLFISALKVSLEIARVRKRPQKVFMVGFDFDSDAGYAEVRGGRFESGTPQDRRLVIDVQENFLLNALYMLSGSEIDVVHVGYRNYSGITPEDLSLAASSPQFGGTGRRWNVAIVAELTTNHFGDRTRLERMVRAAKGAGADYVKVQKRDVDRFYSPSQLSAPYRSPFGNTFGDYRRQLELSHEDFHFLSDLCKRIGIGWFASTLDYPSYKFLQELCPAFIKLPSTISEHREFLGQVAADHRGPLILSTGMTDQDYERWVLETFTVCSRLILLQCNSAYPTPAVDCNVGVVRHYDRLSQTNSRIVPGYSSHDEGWFGSVLAVSAGARMIEKHVKFGNTEWAHFDAVALDLTTPAFREYVTKIREAEIIVGSEQKEVRPSEHHKYR